VFYLFLLGVAAAGTAIYLLLVAGLFPGLKEERFGVLEPLPPNLGNWEVDEQSEAARQASLRGETREVRYIYEEGGLLRPGRLLRQVRFRNAESKAIARVEPDEVVKRKRIKPTPR
jgi:hypothetical protein